MAARKPLLSARNRKARLDFASEYRDWTVEQWRQVLWSDESSVELFDCRRRVYVRRRQGERFREECLVPSVKFGGGKLMIWGCFSGTGLGEICRVEGTVDQKKYQAILQETMLPSANRLFGREKFVFQHDNAPCHAARSVADFLHQKKISVMKWPPQSPDLNPIENLWSILKRKVGLTKPSSLPELWENLRQSWQQISQAEIDKLIASMPQRIKLVIKAKGGATRY